MPLNDGRELSRKLKAMGTAAGGKALRSAAMTSTLPVVHRGRANVPRRRPNAGPRKTYKGRIAAPGFASRSVKRKSFLTADGNLANVLIGVAPEAFYAVEFVELGKNKKHKQTPYPWLVPALFDSIPEIDTKLQARLVKLIDKATKL
jgi:hypothetical protein